MGLSSDYWKNIKLDGLIAKLIKQKPNSFENCLYITVVIIIQLINKYLRKKVMINNERKGNIFILVLGNKFINIFLSLIM